MFKSIADRKTRSRPRAMLWAIGLSCGIVALTYSDPAAASDRRFTYTYQSLVLHPGAVEIEPWTTFRVGRDAFYARIDQRIEFELGLTHRLMTAWYLNLSSVTRDTATTRETSFSFQGVSWEWKFKLFDPVADPIGMALYFEAGVGTSEAELEWKLIVDKQIGNFLTALNIVGEFEWEYEDKTKTEKEGVFEIDIGAAYFFTPALAAGIELRSKSKFEVGEGLEHSAIFGGPVVSYAANSWWVAATVLPQLGAFKGATNGPLDLGGFEAVEGRILFGIHL